MKLVLRDYQEAAVSAALAAKHASLKMPTGSGKSIVGLGWVNALTDKMGRQPRVLIVVPTQILIFQNWTPKLKEYGFNDIGEYYALNKQLGQITVTTYASLQQHPEMLDMVDVVILDEVHHLNVRWYDIIERLLAKEYILGLSATPDQATEELFPTVYDLQIRELMQGGHLSELRTIEMSVPLTSEEIRTYNILTRIISRAVEHCGPNIRDWIRDWRYGQPALRANPQRSQLLTIATNKLAKLLELVQNNPDELIIVFTDSAKVLPQVEAYLQRHGITTCVFTAKTPKKKRLKLMERWGHDFQVLIACRVLDEGVDVPEVRLGVLMSGTHKERQLIQRLGRILRPRQNKIAEFYIISAAGTIETGNTGFYETVNKIVS